MGYESRLIIVDRNKFDDWSDYAFADKIAEFNLCGVPWNHKEIFTEPIDFDIYVNRNDEIQAVRTDGYGKHCGMADVETVIAELERLDAEDNYRRYKPAIGLLKGFNPSEWNDLKVVHYGY